MHYTVRINQGFKYKQKFSFHLRISIRTLSLMKPQPHGDNHGLVASSGGHGDNRQIVASSRRQP